MAKALPLAIGGLGLTGAVGGGILMASKGGGASAASKPAGGPTSQPAKPQLLFDSLDKFKQSPTTSECVKDHFKNLTIGGSATEISTTAPTTGDTEFFKTAGDAEKSCLVVNWKKEEYTDKKWKGKFTWLWTFKRGDEGFVSFQVAENAAAENKVKFTGGFYLVKKKESGEDWETKYKKEVTGDTVKKDVNSLAAAFPKIKDNFAGRVNDYWEFAASEGELKKVCGTSDCTGTPSPTIKMKKWNWTKATGETGTSPADWANNPDWFENVYSGIAWKANEKVASYKGTWAAA